MRSYLYLIFKVGFYQKFSLPSRKCIPPFDFFWIIHVVYVSFLLRLTNSLFMRLLGISLGVPFVYIVALNFPAFSLSCLTDA
jgi:hypothetical protein